MIRDSFIKSRVFSQNRRDILIVLSCLFLAAGLCPKSVFALGFIGHHVNHKHIRGHGPVASASKHHKLLLALNAHKKSTNSSFSLTSLVSNLQPTTIAPGVVYKKSHGALRINVLDIDTAQAPVLIKPIVAPPGAVRLQTVNSLALANHALAAINANYFKNTGIPLGTLVIDGDWIAGPLYERVALGISRSGFPRIDKVNLGGMLTTSNLEAPKIWVNNVNQQHRTGSHVIAYTRRWGNYAWLPYDGTLIAIDAQGEVIARGARQLTIPYGGFVLTDSKDSSLSNLRVGDLTYLHWQVTPSVWEDVTQAVSGGPMLLKNGEFCVDLQSEKFRSSWASNHIKARTGCAVTADNHLLLVTVEGTHTIFDLAHILKDLGAVDAMNLDGGGSTTMVVHNATVNIESKSSQRRVAAALGIFVVNNDQKSAYDHPCRYVPRQSVLDPIGNNGKNGKLPDLSSADQQEKSMTQDILNTVLNIAPTITADSRTGDQTPPSINTHKAL